LLEETTLKNEKEKIADGNENDHGKIKKPYRKPSFRHEKVFETNALSCGKISTTQSQCRLNLRNS
jgi:hypothetical protein